MNSFIRRSSSSFVHFLLCVVTVLIKLSTSLSALMTVTQYRLWYHGHLYSFYCAHGSDTCGSTLCVHAHFTHISARDLTIEHVTATNLSYVYTYCTCSLHTKCLCMYQHYGNPQVHVHAKQQCKEPLALLY